MFAATKYTLFKMTQHISALLSNNFSERLDLALKLRGLSRGALAGKIGIHRSSVSRWKGPITPTPEIMTRIAEELCIRREWLSAGLGEMEPVAAETRLTEPAAVYVTPPRKAAGTGMADSVMLLLHDVPTPRLYAWLGERLTTCEGAVDAGERIPEDTRGLMTAVSAEIRRRSL